MAAQPEADDNGQEQHGASLALGKYNRRVSQGHQFHT